MLNVSESNVSLIEEQREVVQPRKVGVCLRFGCVLVFLLKKKKKPKKLEQKLFLMQQLSFYPAGLFLLALQP